jgi:DNA-binding transcriptional LysR family regulator
VHGGEGVARRLRRNDATFLHQRLGREDSPLAVLTTTNLIAETDMVGMMPLSIAGTCAKHGLLAILPCHIQHKMEAFGSITRKDRPLSEAAGFFLAALQRRLRFIPD